MILRLIILGVVSVAFIGLVTQIMLPALFNRPLLPVLNSRRRRALRKLEEAKERQDLAGLEKSVTHAQFRVADIETETYEETQSELDKLINN